MGAPKEIQRPWPGYRKYPERLNLAQEVLDTSIERGFGNRPALIGPGGAITYEELNRQVNALAAKLIELGLKERDTALIVMSNSAEFAVAFLAAVKLGIIPV
ncbi:MAG TPA: AMP-binding protein, partial [Candidatus Binatia bacterium]|nr:AMP-binding protein [Candidatus Binatia bacterium]